MTNVSIRVVAWSIWLVLLVTFIGYIVPVSAQLSEPFSERTKYALHGGNQITLEIVLGIAALLEAALTVYLRYYLLKKVNKGDIALDSLKGKFRFMIIHLGNWLIAGMIVSTGIVFSIVARHTVLTYCFFALYICLMLFLSPWLSPYLQVKRQKTNKQLDSDARI